MNIDKLIEDDVSALAAIYANFPTDKFGDLTYSEVRVMLVLIRRLKVRLELLEAEFEKQP